MDDEHLLTTKELAAFLRTSTAHIYNLSSRKASDGALPQHVNFGRKKLWIKSEVLRWLNAQQHVNKNHKLISGVSSGPKLNKL